jgi:multicomponent Na+:H+ antiporter subunit E
MTRPRHRPHLPAVVVLTAVWVLLWDRPTVIVLISGILLAVLIGLVFPLPPIELHGRIRPLSLIKLGARLLADVVRSSLAIVRLAFRFGYTPRSAIVRVQLRSHFDLYLTQTAELVSLVPGTIVVEARRATSTLYLHVLDTVSDADLEHAVREALGAEARAIRAFGSKQEIAELNGSRPEPVAPRPEPVAPRPEPVEGREDG